MHPSTASFLHIPTLPLAADHAAPSILIDELDRHGD
jgi:hypothetical protein